MRTLVIDTATKACSVALFKGSDCIAAHHEIIGRGHAEKLLPYIAALPEKGRAERIRVNIGPGSFTGIRVGISAAKALGFAWGADTKGYNCLSLIAAMAAAEHGFPVDVAMAGGHGEYFFQQFGPDGIASAPPISLPPEKAAHISNADIIAGDMAQQLATLTGAAKPISILPDARNWHLISAAQTVPVRPFYGRAPDAKPAQIPAS